MKTLEEINQSANLPGYTTYFSESEITVPLHEDHYLISDESGNYLITQENLDTESSLTKIGVLVELLQPEPPVIPEPPRPEGI